MISTILVSEWAGSGGRSRWGRAEFWVQSKRLRIRLSTVRWWEVVPGM